MLDELPFSMYFGNQDSRTRALADDNARFVVIDRASLPVVDQLTDRGYPIDRNEDIVNSAGCIHNYRDSRFLSIRHIEDFYDE